MVKEMLPNPTRIENYQREKQNYNNC